MTDKEDTSASSGNEIAPPSVGEGSRSSSTSPPATSVPPNPTTTTTPPVLPVDVPAEAIPTPTQAGIIVCREISRGKPCLRPYNTLQQYFGHLRTHPQRKQRGSTYEKLMPEGKGLAGQVEIPPHPEIIHEGTFDPSVLLPSKLLDEKMGESVESILPNALLEIAKKHLKIKSGGEEAGSSSGGPSLRPDGLVIDVNETPKGGSASPPPKKHLKIDVNKTPPNSSSDENESFPSK